MPTPFDPGYGEEPFRTLVRDVPDGTVFPTKDFRTEWGPVFHRGRLDGTARLLVIGQDPAQHEIIVRRNLVGGAGHRIQGFLAKLGLTRSYVMVNTFVYSVFGQGGGNRHRNDPAIIAYRNQWFDALLPQQVKGVVALGQLADARSNRRRRLTSQRHSCSTVRRFWTRSCRTCPKRICPPAVHRGCAGTRILHAGRALTTR